jgi:hypothetical protein
MFQMSQLWFGKVLICESSSYRPQVEIPSPGAHLRRPGASLRAGRHPRLRGSLVLHQLADSYGLVFWRTGSETT